MAQDKHANMGGSYVINEAGEKVLVHRTDHDPEPAAPAPKAAGKHVTAAKRETVKQNEGDKA